MRAEGDRLRWAGGELISLTDSFVRFGRELFPDPRGAVLPETIVLPVHAYLLRREGRAPVLIDTGSGGAEAGVARGLAALGIAKADVGAVVFTHLHGDHRGGYLEGGYEEARVLLSQAEADFWAGQDHPARTVLDKARDRLHLVRDGDVLEPGLRVWALPGHTPGHIGLVIDNQIAVVGDILHRADLQLGNPDLATRFDTDAALATATRKAALARIVEHGMVVCGGHMRLPGQEEAEACAGFLRLSRGERGWEARVA